MKEILENSEKIIKKHINRSSLYFEDEDNHRIERF
jgi:hypothetical protein